MQQNDPGRASPCTAVYLCGMPGCIFCAMATPLVVTPFGPRPANSVHLIPKGSGVTRQGGVLQQIDMATGALTDLATSAVPAPPPTTGWIADATWLNETGIPITYFATSWVVPPAPTTSSGQTIFLFNGMQNDVGHILQPVLQWGPSGAGGGDYWSVASWYAENGPSCHTDPIRVDPGTVLVGVMQRIGRPKLPAPYQGKLTYSCEFVGIAGTRLIAHDIPELTSAVETLEVVQVTRCSDYPDAVSTRMIDIEIKLNDDEAELDWTPGDLVTDCGQHAVVVSNASPGGEVDLFYGPVAPPQQVGLVGTSAGPALSTFGTGLYLAWKGVAGDERIWWAFFDEGAWGPQNQLPGATTSGAPALTAFGDYLYAAWKAPDPDQGIHTASYDGSVWSEPTTVPAVGTAVGPGLAPKPRTLQMAWDGPAGDDRIYWDERGFPQPWTLQRAVPGASTSDRPALARYDGMVFMAWKGPVGDRNIYWTTFTD
jgi:hypothetical protein